MSIKFNINGNLNNNLASTANMLHQIRKLPDEAYKFFVGITPIDTGNARKSTSKSGNTINANYPYAKRLDEGWSKQAKDGMVKPTEAFLRKRMHQITGK